MDPTLGCELASDQPGPTSEQPGSDRDELDPRALDSDIGSLLPGFPVAESIVVNLDRLLAGLLQRELLPVADQAAAMGVDPSPLLDLVSDLLRRYADALERPHDATP